MIGIILIVLFSLIFLTALHELGHFVFAKKFGVKVEEFGIGYPPRLFGKKIGETVYSLNLLPFGAFVKILGEDGQSKDKRSFTAKRLWQRALIIIGGVVTFWIIAFLLLTFIAGFSGIPEPVPDDLAMEGAQVMVFSVSSDSPAEKSGIKIEDVILRINETEIKTSADVQDAVNANLGKETEIELQRRGENIVVNLTPRENPPQGEGAMGVGLLRVANIKAPWYKAPLTGAEITYRQTKAIPVVLYRALVKKLKGEKVTEIQFVGPIGVGKMLGQAVNQGLGRFLMLISMISIWLALFNIFPIPALDGGRLLFLIIEGVRRKPMPPKIEQKINAGFFILLILLMVFVTVRDVIGLF